MPMAFARAFLQSSRAVHQVQHTLTCRRSKFSGAYANFAYRPTLSLFSFPVENEGKLVGRLGISSCVILTRNLE